MQKPKPPALHLPKSFLPPAPTGVDAKQWANMQQYLRSKDVPTSVVAGITTLRRMNLFIMAMSFPTNVYFQPDYKWVLDNENNPKELSKLLIWRQRLQERGLKVAGDDDAI